MSQPRLVLDTNVLISAFLWRGAPGKLIELLGEQEARAFTSHALLDELAATLLKKKLQKYVAATGASATDIVASYRRLATTVTARQLEARVSRDADDDVVLACGLAARADLIISGDDDLLVLESFSGIPIISVGAAIRLLARKA
jgi:putative PIN family toxin of toxin-antitoxin system